MKAIRTAILASVIFGLAALPAVASAHEWQHEGNPVKGTVETESEGTLVFENKNEKYSFTCKLRDKGLVGELGAAQISSITNRTNGKLIKCETKTSTTGCESEVELEAVHLPWVTELVTLNGALRNRITNLLLKPPEWKITCRILGMMATNRCQATSLSPKVKNLYEGVETVYDETAGLTSCELDTGKPFVVTSGLEATFAYGRLQAF